MTNNVNCDEEFEHVSNSNFLYVHAQFPNCNRSAMLDSGSSIKCLRNYMMLITSKSKLLGFQKFMGKFKASNTQWMCIF